MDLAIYTRADAAAAPTGARGVLYLDVEGGWGGSSRSLFYLVEALDRGSVSPVVLLRKSGPIEARYRSIGVPCHVVPDLAPFRPSERKNVVAFAMFLWRLRRARRLSRTVGPLIKAHRVSLIHVNHESLACIGAALAWRFRIPWVIHVRTLLVPGWFVRRVSRMVARRAHRAIFITEPNRVHFRELAGPAFDPSKAAVIHNIMPVAAARPDLLPALQSPADRFRVLSLTNFSRSRGVDRIVDVAAALKARGAHGFAFYLCGRPAHTNLLSGRESPYFQEIVDRVKALGLGDMVFFPGHVAEPERALATCDALIKLTRQSNPWGRDIMEALAAGIPVVTLGSFQGFVENGVNGFIDLEFDPRRVADHLVALAASPALRERMRADNREKARALFDGAARARDVVRVYAGVPMRGGSAGSPTR